MTTTINPELFVRIMALPAAVRRHLLDFVGSTFVESGRLEKMVENLSSLPVDPGND